MRILVNTLYYTYKIIGNKCRSLQICWIPRFVPQILIDIDIYRFLGNVYSFNVEICGLFVIHIYKDEKRDHCGFTFHLNILGLDIEYCNRDTRHWDYDRETYEGAE